MKKLFALLLCLCCLLTAVACTEPEPQIPAADVTVRLAGLKGPTSMGLVKLMSEGEAGTSRLSYTSHIYTAADEITALLLKGELDIAALPANAAANLYQKSNGAIEVLAVNTLGVVCVVETGNTIQSFADLKGKTVHAVGKGTTPEYGLRYLLAQNQVDLSFEDIDFVWHSEATEILPLLKAAGEDESVIAMIPQPFVTAASVQVPGLRTALDLNEEWQKLDNGSAFVTGVLVARRAFVEENAAAVATFLTEYAASVSYAQTDLDGAAALVVQYGILEKAAIAKKALPHCSLTCVTGTEMKSMLSAYLQTLYDLNPAAIGGSMPDSAFYYTQS